MWVGVYTSHLGGGVNGSTLFPFQTEPVSPASVHSHTHTHTHIHPPPLPPLPLTQNNKTKPKQGLWGMALMLGIVFPLAYLLPGSDAGGCVENVWDALAMVQNSHSLQMILLLFFVSVRGVALCGLVVFVWMMDGCSAFAVCRGLNGVGVCGIDPNSHLRIMNGCVRNDKPTTKTYTGGGL